ncbi:hypothetical protein [Massilia sp. METH4]|uniref:hypothetical protein n=1 Tax=Massilia sp. METH4 TaxID=3123041 RepID=UPI0030D0E2DD
MMPTVLGINRTQDASACLMRGQSPFYMATRHGVECVAKQLWDRDDDNPVGLGMFYFLLADAIFPGEGNEGGGKAP